MLHFKMCSSFFHSKLHGKKKIRDKLPVPLTFHSFKPFIFPRFQAVKTSIEFIQPVNRDCKKTKIMKSFKSLSEFNLPFNFGGCESLIGKSR